jgi:hypothetical protein
MTQPALPGVDISNIDQRAAEAARIAFEELFPQFSPEAIPPFYFKVAKIVIRSIEEGLV